MKKSSSTTAEAVPDPFKSVPEFTYRLGAGEYYIPGEGLPPAAFARRNLLHVMCCKMPTVFEDAIARVQRLEMLSQGPLTWKWRGPFRDAALAWAAEWRLGDENHAEFAYLVFRFASIEAHIRGGFDYRIGTFPVLQTDASIPLCGEASPPEDYDWGEEYPAPPVFDTGIETLEEFFQRFNEFAATYKEVARCEDAYARRVGGVRSETVRSQNHYLWLLAHQVARMSFREIKEAERRASLSTIREAVHLVAARVGIPVDKLPPGPKKTAQK
jgi:hypothetical protein